MNKILTLVFFVCAFFALACNAQQINQITARCPTGNRTVYGSVLVNSVGNIVYTPCPTKSSIFTGIADFTGATVTGISGTISGGTLNYVPRFASATTLTTTPFSWDGTTYLFDTAAAANAAFRFSFVPSNADVGRARIGDFTNGDAYIDINEGVGNTVTVAGDNINLTAPTGQISFGVSGSPLYVLVRTITPGGTTGAQTINKPNGSVNVAAGQSTIVITNNTVTTSSLINAVANTNDATCSVKNAVATANTITITMTANCTAETRVAFWSWN